MVRHGAAVLAVMFLSACAPVTPDSIEGDWTFAEYTVDGETHDVVWTRTLEASLGSN